MRWLTVAVLLLLLANAGWWWLRGDGGLSWQLRPTPVATEVAPVEVAPITATTQVDASSARSGAASSPPAPRIGESVAPVGSVASTTGPAGLLVPVQGMRADTLHDTFGDARGGDRSHEALDIMAPAGTPVLAVADGHVEKLFDSDRGGLTLYQFEPSGRWCYYYAHLQSYAPGMAEGATLKRGQVIGYVGSTGNADPAAPHLHFAVFALTPERQWWTGTPLNPYPLLTGKSVR